MSIRRSNGGLNELLAAFPLRIRAVDAEHAFVRDEAEEKNSEANKSPTDGNRRPSPLQQQHRLSERLESRLVLFCVTNTGLKGWTGPGSSARRCPL
jgi:hypothetical protein